ncbi:2'-5' RNA ligase family protein [Luteimonas wenzhouensis]|uniref:RNA 2',3'-cyclic phosphodiesterase n=1 Tax=Luteimonas wenzhouensis TaxID=2599615 RepID=A0A5C5U7I9_9GAMM|nr:2'-5' RNA ligase family protein [Luteimonas wenzhouensis]TWT21876.1 hypothetical protein FQY79_01755 [Luteimonas wenzhouensis]
MSRALFPGWRPDAAGREQLAAILARLRAAWPAGAPPLRPRRPDQWHATLCFLGHDMAHVVTPALLDALADVAARVAPHALEIGRLDYWPRPGVVVALPRNPAPLQTLCDAVDAAVRACGVAAAQATTRPHITLAHTDRGLAATPWLAGVDCRSAPLRVDDFELLVNPGGRYEPLGRWRLSGGAGGS